MPLPSWEAAQSEDLLGRWAMNLMLINVSSLATKSQSCSVIRVSIVGSHCNRQLMNQGNTQGGIRSFCMAAIPSTRPSVSRH
jgi:uncharacterized protein (DUF2336 family)